MMILLSSAVYLQLCHESYIPVTLLENLYPHLQSVQLSFYYFILHFPWHFYHHILVFDQFCSGYRILRCTILEMTTCFGCWCIRLLSNQRSCLEISWTDSVISWLNPVWTTRLSHGSLNILRMKCIAAWVFPALVDIEAYASGFFL